MRKFFMWSGGIVVVLVFLIVFVGGLYSEHQNCKDYYSLVRVADLDKAPESTLSSTPDWLIVSHCSGVQNNLYLSLYFIAVGVGMVAGGFIVRD